MRQVMGHWVRGMFAGPGRSRGACAVHSLWQQKDCQRCLWWVSHAHTHTLTRTSLCFQACGMLYFIRLYFVPVCSKIKVWDLQAALDPRAPASTLCLRTLVVRHAAVLSVRIFFGVGMKSDMKCWFGFVFGRSILEGCSVFSLMSFRSSAVLTTTPFWSGISWTSPPTASQRGGLPPALTRIFLDSRYKN